MHRSFAIVRQSRFLFVLTFFIGAISNANASPPPAPAGLTAQVYGGSITLQWSYVSEADSYNIYRSTTSGGEGSVPYATDVSPYFNFYEDSDTVSGTTYYYQVSAVSNVDGESALSNEASGTSGATPLNPPTLLNVVAGNSQTILAWAAVAGATSYILYRDSMTSDGDWLRTDYDPPLLQMGITGTTYTDTGLTNGLYYGYWVQAVNTSGASSLSNALMDCPGTRALASPTGLTAQSYGSTSVVLQWIGVEMADSYNIYRSTTSGGEGIAPYATGVLSGVNSYQDTNAVSGTTYYYKVSTVSETNGEGGLSNEASATAGVTPLSAPTLTGSVSDGSVQLSWTSVAGATCYVINRSSELATSQVQAYQQVTSSCSFTDANAVPGPMYTYYVSAADTDGIGESSNGVTATLPGFGLAANPTTVSISQGSSGTATISTPASTASTYGNFTGSIALTASGAPSGAAAWMYPPLVMVQNNCNPGTGNFPGNLSNDSQRSTLEIVVGAIVPVGTYSLTVTGVAGADTPDSGMTVTLPVTLIVTAGS